MHWFIALFVFCFCFVFGCYCLSVNLCSLSFIFSLVWKERISKLSCWRVKVFIQLLAIDFCFDRENKQTLRMKLLAHWQCWGWGWGKVIDLDMTLITHWIITKYVYGCDQSVLICQFLFLFLSSFPSSLSLSLFLSLSISLRIFG